MPNGAKWDIVRHDEADRRFDLLRRRAKDRAINSDRSNGPMEHVVDLVVLEAKDLGQAAANLVEAEHGEERAPAIPAGDLRCRENDRIEVVVAKLAALVASPRVITKVGAVGVQLADRGAIRNDRLLGRDQELAAKAGGALGIGVTQCLFAEQHWRVGLRSEGGNGTADAVQMKLLDLSQHGIVGPAKLARQKVDRVMPDPAGLVFATRQR